MKSLVKFINENNPQEWRNIRDAIDEIWVRVTDPDDAYDSRRDWKNDMEAMADGTNDPLMEIIFNELINAGFNENKLNKYWNDILNYCITLASDDLATW